MVQQRTLLVLFGPSAPVEPIQQLLDNHGFRRVALQACVGEELEEAGLELRLGTGEVNGRSSMESDHDPDVEHGVLVLECDDAVRRLRELCGEGAGSLNRNALSNIYPDLKFHCSPSVSAAQLTIEALFPNIDDMDVTATTMASLKLTPAPASPSSASVATPPPKPFALSNAAYAVPEQPLVSNKDKLSPSIERALREVELREQQQKRSPFSRSPARSQESLRSRNGAPESDRRDFRSSSPRSEDEELDEVTSEMTKEASELEELSEDGDELIEEEDELVGEDSVDEDESFAEADELGPEDVARFEEKAVPQCEEEQEEGEESTGSILIAASDDGEEGGVPMSPVSIVSLVEDFDSPLRSRTNSMASATSSTTPGGFRARPLPPTHAAPTVQPRMTKAAALRLGIELPPRTPRASNAADLPNPSLARIVELPKSLATPAITPRATKASALRVGGGGSMSASGRPSIGAAFAAPSSAGRMAMGTAERSALARRDSMSASAPLVSSIVNKPKIEVRLSKTAALRTGAAPSDTMTPRRRSDYRSALSSPSMTRGRAIVALEDLDEEGDMPRVAAWGAERPRQSLSVSSTAPPKIAPRMTKTAKMRTGVDLAPPQQRSRASSVVSDDSTFSFEGVPGHKRRESIPVASTARPAVEPKMTKTARLRAGLEVEASPAAPRRTSGFDFGGVPGHPRRQSFVVPAVVKPPSITPRLNRSAMLRANPNDVMTLVSPSRPRSSLGFMSSPRPGSSLSMASSMSRTTAMSASFSGVRMATAKSPLIVPRSNKAAELRSAKADLSPPSENSRRTLASGWDSTPKARRIMARPSTVMSFVNDGNGPLVEMNGFRRRA